MPFSFGAQLISLGSSKGGALTLKVPLVQIGASAAAPVPGQLTLPASFFASGFSSYDVTGYNGVTVADGMQLQVVEPVFQITAASARAPTGTDPAAAMTVWLPPLFTPNPVTAQLTQRQGASLALHALQTNAGGSLVGAGGPLTIGTGAAITLDPGQTATLEAFRQITINGTVTVPGGKIRVSNYAEIQLVSQTELIAPQQYLLTPAPTDSTNFAAGMSIWLGPNSRLDTAGVSATARDLYGRSYGIAQDGGTITVGSPLAGITTAAYVVARPGSVLDASGAAAATIDQDAGVAPVLTGSRLVAPTNTVSVAGAGGSISLDSESGIVLDGTMRAASGGARAQGGSLSVTLSTPNFGTALATLLPAGQTATGGFPVLADSQRVPRELIVGQTATPSGLSLSLKPGDANTPFQPGQARISVAQIAAGGFDSVSLASDDLITFDGNVSLSVGRMLSLKAGSLAETRPNGVVTLSAPYVSLSGVAPSNGTLGGMFSFYLSERGYFSDANTTNGTASLYTDPTGTYQWQPYAGASTASLVINAGVIDVSGPVTFGYSVGSYYTAPPTPAAPAGAGAATITYLTDTYRTGIPSAEEIPAEEFTYRVSSRVKVGRKYVTEYSQNYFYQYAPSLISQHERPGFAQITLSSTGDLRFQPDKSGAQATLVTSGSLTLSAAQIYPVAGANARVYAGVTFDPNAANFFQPGGRIVISSPGGALPPPPLTAGGTLLLAAGEIDQGGVLRAPFGQIALGATGNESGIDAVFNLGSQSPATFTTEVKLLPGSLTSVSGEGATIPYGGTTDGTSYSVCATGSGCATVNLSANTPSIAPTVSLIGQSIAVGQGAALDLSGGGTLAGSAFIFGRGGSYDVLQTPLLRLSKTNTVTAPKLATNEVYAILPGPQVDVAPAQQTQTAWTGSPLPAVGQQVTIGAGVPGLPAGTYTLLPANYALLPGAYRVELATTNHTLLPGAIALGNGSYVINGAQGVAGTGFRDALPIQVTVSSGTVVRNDAQYNEESYSQYVVGQAALFGAVRAAYIPADAGTLVIALAGGPQQDGSGRTAFSFAGQANFGVAAGGYGGDAEVFVLGSSAYSGLDILPAGGLPEAGNVGVPAADLNALGAATLSVGGIPQFGANSDIVTFNTGSTLTAEPVGIADSPVTLRSGAVLRAPQVFLLTTSQPITVEQGAGIDTLGLGFTGLDFAAGVVYQPQNPIGSAVNVLAVSNGQLVFLPPANAATGSIAIGTCGTPGLCSGTTTLYTDGTIAFASSNASFGAVTFGASRLNVSVDTINLGAASALAAAQAAAGGTLSGLTLTDTALATLLAGVPSADPSVAIPSLQHLTLTANALNLHGTADPFNPATTSARLGSIVLNTPAIYGYGTASDTFTLTAGTFYWNGVAAGTTASATPGNPSGKLGTGTLNVSANSIVFGYGPEDQPNSGAVTLNRVVQGFNTVNLIATDQITANNAGSLAVTGNLTLTTPMLTGQAGSVNTITATGVLRIVGANAAAPAGVGSLGAELRLGGDPSLNIWPQSIDIDTAIGLPGGRLTVNATGDVTLGAGSNVDLSGRPFVLFDQTNYGWGGDVLVESAKGNVTQAPGGRIDVSAVNADAGSITITATAASGGAVTLAGTLHGASTGTTPGAGGSFGVRVQALGGAGTLSDAFGTLNAALDAGGFYGSRTFDLKQGNLDITGAVTANDVEVSVDNGSLTVGGTINASGPHPGTIRLAAQTALVIGGGARLDAHATQAWTDSYGVPIPAENRATIELTAAGTLGTTNTTLQIDPGARIDVSSPAAAQIGNQGVVLLNVADLPGSAKVSVSVPAGVSIAGAQSVALYGFATAELNSGTVTQPVLSGLSAKSQAFVASGTAGDDLSGLLALGSAYHLRPGVQIVSDGGLTVSGTIDLSQFRYGSEPGALVLRAADTLTITGSITDGFALASGQPVGGGTLLGGSSWSLRLVAGTDLGAADSRMVRAASALPAPTAADPDPGTITLGTAGSYDPTNGQFNVVRTGTGDLELLAAGDVQELSPYGVYTAGSQQGAVAPAFVFGVTQPVSYPAGGGNLLVSAQGDVGGYIQLDSGLSVTNLPSDGIGNWLWRQGGSGVTTQVGSRPAAWGINFGSSVNPLNLDGFAPQAGETPHFVGFTGFGALGGGNVTVLAGGNAGAQANASSSCAPDCTSSGLDVAVASTGRMSNGSLMQTGGGDVIIRVGGNLNPASDGLIQQLNGTVTDLRGAISIRAGAIGQAPSTYATNVNDPRTISPLAATGVNGSDGITVAPGDTMVSIETRRDLVIGAVSDPTRLPQQYLSTLTTSTGSVTGLTWFSLWQPRTEVDLFSLGGNVTPTTQSDSGTYGVYDSGATESTAYVIRAVYPPTLKVMAANGSIGYQPGGQPTAVELAPAAYGQLELLAAGSIIGSYTGTQTESVAFDISGAATGVLPTPSQPAFAESTFNGKGVSNLSESGGQGALHSPTAWAFLTDFAFGPDTASGTLHVGDSQPALVYAGVDIVNFRTGETRRFNPSYDLRPWYVAGKPVEIRAGNDIVGTGDSGLTNPTPDSSGGSEAGDLFLNDTAADVSSIVAGRDIIYANAQILGPGTLEVQSGRNLYQAAQGVLESLGVVNRTPGSLAGGADIIAIAGVGAAGPDWTRFASLYLNPASQAASGTPIDAGASNGKVAATYQSALFACLEQNFGYTGSVEGALGFFQALPVAQQQPFLLQTYFTELRLSGREFNDPKSARAKSYVRGREAIAALFPGTGYQGGITLYGSTTVGGKPVGGSLIRTDAGGAISLLAPGGQLLLGRTTDSVNSTNTGVLTEGQGDIGIYTWGSVLLGTSRVFTTFGGGITIWSAAGDINAGRSSNSVSVFSPVSIDYDPFGNVTVLPQPPAEGGGIATLAPLAGTAPGDVDLIAPLGTIDAGEAGIRVSGNANIAALTVVNAANIQVQGHASGLPSVVMPNLGALAAASAVSGASSQAASQAAGSRTSGAAAGQTASVISVEVTGFGGE